MGTGRLNYIVSGMESEKNPRVEWCRTNVVSVIETVSRFQACWALHLLVTVLKNKDCALSEYE